MDLISLGADGVASEREPLGALRVSEGAWAGRLSWLEFYALKLYATGSS